MTRGVLSRVGAIGDGAYWAVQDTFFMRLVVTAARLWPAPRLVSVLLIVLLALCLVGAGFTAKTVFLGVQPAAAWLIWPILAALLAFVVMLEVVCASLMSALLGLLRLSYDLGRHRIGALLSMIALMSVAIALLALRVGATTFFDIILLWGVALILLASAIWFERAYRRPSYPGFRDFHGDVVAARQHFARTAHVQ